MSNLSDIEFVLEDSSFKPRFYIVFIIVFSIYYFFAPIISRLIFLFIRNNLRIVDGNFLYQLFSKFFIPYFSIFLVLILYIFFIEERKIFFLFLNEKIDFMTSFIKGVIFSTVFLFVLIFVLILGNNTLSFRLNKDFIFFLNFFQLVLVFVFTYLKNLFLEVLYRGWLLNILNFRYNILVSILLTSLVPTINIFLEHQRIGFYILNSFLINVFVAFVFLVYRNIFVVVAFSCFYEFLKKYILSLESMAVNLEPMFFTIINNTELYNLENNYYTCGVLLVFISIAFMIYKMKHRSYKNAGQVM